MKRSIMPILAVTAGAAFLYSSAQAMSRANSAKVTSANLVAQLTVDPGAVPHAVDSSMSTMTGTYTVTNPTSQPVTFAQHGQAVTWQVLDSKGNVVCNPDAGKMRPMFVMMRRLGPNQHVDYKSNIKLQDQAGAPLPAGNYVLQACLLGTDSLQTKKSFTIK